MPSKKFDRRDFLRLTTAGAAAGVAALALGQSAKTETGDFYPVRVAPGIYFHKGKTEVPSKANKADIATIALIVGDETAALVDTGYSFSLGRLALKQATALTDKPIKWVINTHVHPDHTFGNYALAAEAKFCGHSLLPRIMAETAPHYLAYLGEVMGKEAEERVKIVPPVTLVSRDKNKYIDLGNRRLRLEAWPLAHTSTDITVFDESSGVLITGDLVFDEHVPTLDGSALGWLKVLGELKKRDEIKTLVPGHGEPRSDWRAQIGKVEEYLQTLVADVKEMIRQGTSLSRAATLAAASQRGKWQLFDHYNPRNVAKAFVEMEWA